MREILFRGRRCENLEWVYGCYYKQTEFYGEEWENHIIITSSECLSFDQALDFNIVSEITVGQYTGLTDKNGKKIFEGDLIRHYNQSNHPEAYDLYRIEFDVRGCMWVGRYNDNYAAQLRNYLGEHYEVVGNIHDNPELLAPPKGE